MTFTSSPNLEYGSLSNKLYTYTIGIDMESSVWVNEEIFDSHSANAEIPPKTSSPTS